MLAPKAPSAKSNAVKGARTNADNDDGCATSGLDKRLQYPVFTT